MKRKKIVLAALAQVVLLLVFCTPLAAKAAVTWQEEESTWKCYEKDGTLVTERWVREGGSYYYLDENGRMAVDALVEYNDNYYYVDGDGVRVTNSWVCIPNEFGLWDEDVENIWYYFNSTGKALRDGKKTIGDKKYLFDDEGRMLSGWQRWGDEEDLYYLGTCDEGWIHTGWQRLEPWYEMDGDYEAEEWFYFRPASGKAYSNVKKNIDGDYYAFDENGVTRDRWNFIDSDGAVASSSDAKPASPSDAEPAWFDQDTGKAWKGWIHACDPQDRDENGDMFWYYLDSKGVPFNYGGKDSGSLTQKVLTMGPDLYWELLDVRCAAKVIEGKTYIFNDKGQMMTGYLYLGNIPCSGGARLGTESRMQTYYFNSEESKKEGQMMTGRQTIEIAGAHIFEIYLNDKGQAYRNFIVGGRLYGPNGVRIDADDDEYRALVINQGTSIKIKGSSRVLTQGSVIVDDSGKVKKDGTVEIDGTRYLVENYLATPVVE